MTTAIFIGPDGTEYSAVAKLIVSPSGIRKFHTWLLLNGEWNAWIGEFITIEEAWYAVEKHIGITHES